MKPLYVKYLIVCLVFLFHFSSKNSNARDQRDIKELKERYVTYRDSAFETARTFPKISLEYAKKSLELAKIIDDSSHISYSYTLIGTVNRDLGEYSDAISSFRLALDYTEDPHQQHSIYNNLGSVYRILGEPELAYKHLSTALDIAIEIADNQAIIDSKINFGNAYISEENYDAAIEFYISAIEDSKKNDSLFKNIPTLYNNIGYSYYCRGEFEHAKTAFLESYNGFEKIGDKQHLAVLLNNLADIELKLKNYKTAEKHIKEAESINNEYNYTKSQLSLYETAYEVYKENNDFAQACYYLEKYHNLKDSIFNLDLQKEINEIKTSYELDKIKSESKIKDISIKHKQKINQFLYIFSILIIAILIFLIITGFQKSKLNKELGNKNLILKDKDAEIKENLQYAREIQLACMNRFQEKEDNVFIIDLPKTSVGGDFYLMRKFKNKVYYILADCTGHGTSAGFLSILGMQFIDFAIEHKNSTSEILSYLNNQFYDYISKSNALRNESICLSIICKEGQKISFSGSMQKLWHYNSSEKIIKEFQTERLIIGLKKDLDFSTINIYTEIGDKIILSSDGFPDQFNENQTSKLKYSRFRSLLLESCYLPLEEGEKFLVSELEKWKGKSEQTDDILLMTIEVRNG